MSLFAILVVGMLACVVAALTCHGIVLYDWYLRGRMTPEEESLWYQRSRVYVVLFHILGAFAFILMVS